jgi:hypothetical protein
MPGPNVAGSLTTGSAASVGNPSDVCVIPTGRTSMRLTVSGLNGSNTVKTQKRTTPGGTFADQVTYNSDQSATAITVAGGEEWRLVTVAMQATRDIRFEMNAL